MVNAVDLDGNGDWEEDGAECHEDDQYQHCEPVTVIIRAEA